MATRLAWSPDGSKITFSSDRAEAGNRDVNYEIYTLKATIGGDIQRLTFTGLGQADFRSDWGTNTTTPPDTGQQLSASDFSCSNTTTSLDFKVPAGTRYNVAISDCVSPRNLTKLVILPNGRVR